MTRRATIAEPIGQALLLPGLGNSLGHNRRPAAQSAGFLKATVELPAPQLAGGVYRLVFDAQVPRGADVALVDPIDHRTKACYRVAANLLCKWFALVQLPFQQRTRAKRIDTPLLAIWCQPLMQGLRDSGIQCGTGTPAGGSIPQSLNTSIPSSGCSPADLLLAIQSKADSLKDHAGRYPAPGTGLFAEKRRYVGDPGTFILRQLDTWLEASPEIQQRELAAQQRRAADQVIEQQSAERWAAIRSRDSGIQGFRDSVGQASAPAVSSIPQSPNPSIPVAEGFRATAERDRPLNERFFELLSSRQQRLTDAALAREGQLRWLGQQAADDTDEYKSLRAQARKDHALSAWPHLRLKYLALLDASGQEVRA